MVRNELAANTKGHGTAELIFILCNILEQSAEWKAPMYINFKKVVDSVERPKLWTILRHYGIPHV